MESEWLIDYVRGVFVFDWKFVSLLRVLCGVCGVWYVNGYGVWFCWVFCNIYDVLFFF